MGNLKIKFDLKRKIERQKKRVRDCVCMSPPPFIHPGTPRARQAVGGGLRGGVTAPRATVKASRRAAGEGRLSGVGEGGPSLEATVALGRRRRPSAGAGARTSCRRLPLVVGARLVALAGGISREPGEPKVKRK